MKYVLLVALLSLTSFMFVKAGEQRKVISEIQVIDLDGDDTNFSYLPKK